MDTLFYFYQFTNDSLAVILTKNGSGNARLIYPSHTTSVSYFYSFFAGRSRGNPQSSRRDEKSRGSLLVELAVWTGTAVAESDGESLVLLMWQLMLLLPCLLRIAVGNLPDEFFAFSRFGFGGGRHSLTVNGGQPYESQRVGGAH